MRALARRAHELGPRLSYQNEPGRRRNQCIAHALVGLSSALTRQRHWVPAFAGTTSTSERFDDGAPDRKQRRSVLAFAGTTSTSERFDDGVPDQLTEGSTSSRSLPRKQRRSVARIDSEWLANVTLMTPPLVRRSRESGNPVSLPSRCICHRVPSRPNCALSLLSLGSDRTLHRLPLRPHRAHRRVTSQARRVQLRSKLRRCTRHIVAPAQAGAQVVFTPSRTPQDMIHADDHPQAPSCRAA